MEIVSEILRLCHCVNFILNSLSSLFFHVTFDFSFLSFSQITKEFKRIIDWDLMPRLNEGLQKYGRTIMERKASHDKLEQLRQNIAACRLEETPKCKYELGSNI